MRVNKVTILVKKAALQFDKLSNPILSEYDLTAAQFKVLKFLYAQPSRTARVVDIKKFYSLTHPTTIGLLDNLEKKGFITRIPNPTDARSKLIFLTGKADSMQSELDRLSDMLESKMTENLTATEKAQLVSLLQKLIESDDGNPVTMVSRKREQIV